MKEQGVRRALLRSGMGCFAFAATATAINVLVLPHARACYGYSAGLTWLAFALAGAALLGAARALTRAREATLARAARIAVPVYLAALFAVHLCMGYWMEYTPSGDNFMLYNGAQMLARDGNFAAYPDFSLYLARFSNQWGFVLMLTALFRRLFALGVTRVFFPLAALQAALFTVGIAAALDIARRLRGARGVLMLLLLLTMCLPMGLAAAVLYTDTFSLPFILLALNFALRAAQATSRRAQLGSAAACGAAVVVGAQIKMTVCIVLIAAVLVWLLSLPTRRAALMSALCAAMLLTVNTGVQQVMRNRILDAAVCDQQHTPVIHWMMMSIPTSDNPYGGATGDYGITWGMMDEGATHEQVMESIYTRIKDRIYTLRYPNRLALAMLRKNAAGMGDGTFGMTEMLDDGPVRENAVSAVVLEGRPHYRAYSAVCAGIWMAQVALAAAGCWRDVRRRDLRTALPAIAMFGMQAFLMIWEARGRYVFGFVPVMLLLSMQGALTLTQSQSGKNGDRL